MAEHRSSEQPDSTERYYAEMEAARAASEDGYFTARPQADFLRNRQLFRAGFERAFAFFWNKGHRP